METIIFKNSGEPLFVKFIVKGGVLAASYMLTLLEKDGLTELQKYKGDNQQVNDDKFQLPKPATVNDGRIIRCSVDFKGLDLARSNVYEMAAELYQGSLLMGSVAVSGSLTGKEQDIMVFAKLKMD